MDKRLIWFERLYDTYADAIWRHLYLRLGDEERAKELMQEVFMKTWRYVRDGNTIAHEKAFLYQTARNLFINEIRTDKIHASLEVMSEQGFDVRDESQRTDGQAELSELHQQLLRLKESYRTVLIMRYVDDLPVKEIAAILAENETTITMRIQRGIEALKQLYESVT